MREQLCIWRKITLSSYYLLIAHLTFWFFIVDRPTSTASAILSVMYLCVLVVPMRKLLQGDMRVYMWSSYLILIYFIHAIVESYANEAERVYALFELVLTIIYFIGSTFCYRYSRQIIKQSSPADSRV